MVSLFAVVLFAGMGLVPPVPTAGAPVAFDAADGITVYARVYEAAPNAPVILLFHQAGSGKSEYATIAPRLVKLGFNALAIDQRSGGDLYQPPNETVAHLGKNAPSYLDAVPDIEAAIAWAKRVHPRSAIYLWGSSYSAALVFVLAARHPHDVAAVLAFSPGEYFPDKEMVHAAARKVEVPVFVDSAADPVEIANARSILAVVPAKHKVQYVPTAGVHGSSTLREDRDPDGADANWAAVVAFLKSLP